MGANPWHYFVPYQPDINKALQDLRKQEFQAGRYYPALDDVNFPITQFSPSLGAQHASIELAMEDAGETGTCSILDIVGISDEPQLHFATPLLPEEQLEYFGTDRPTRQLLETAECRGEILGLIGRGEAVYCLVYKDDEPNEVLFVGYSVD